MNAKKLYRYSNNGGGIIVSTEKPQNAYYMVAYRLTAADGMQLIKGNIRTKCIDTDTLSGWREVKADD